MPVGITCAISYSFKIQVIFNDSCFIEHFAYPLAYKRTNKNLAMVNTALQGTFTGHWTSLGEQPAFFTSSFPNGSNFCEVSSAYLLSPCCTETQPLSPSQ